MDNYTLLENQPDPFNNSEFSEWFLANPKETEEMFSKMNRFLAFSPGSSSQTPYWIFLNCDQGKDWYPMPKSHLVDQFKSFKVEKEVEVGTRDKSKKKLKKFNPFDLWNSSTIRLQIASFVFDPELPSGLLKDEEKKNLVFNRYRGLAPKFLKPFPEAEGQEDLAFVLFHLREVLSRQNEEIFQYLLEWMSMVVRRPWVKTEVVPVFCGVQGAGKSLFWEEFSKIFGQHGMASPDADLLTHKFFGDQLATKVFLVINETSFKTDHDANKLKNQITSASRKIERKGQAVQISKDFLNMVFTSNSLTKSFPAEKGFNRRYFPIEVDPSRANQPDYFLNLTAAFNRWGLHALVKFLLERELNPGINLREPPHTEEKADAVLSIFNELEIWWLQCIRKRNHLEKGNSSQVDPREKYWVTKGTLLWALYDLFRKGLTPKNLENWNEVRFAIEFKNLIPGIESTTSLEEALRNQMAFFEMPPWLDCAVYFSKTKGLVDSENKSIGNKKRKLSFDPEQDRRKITSFFRPQNQ